MLPGCFGSSISFCILVKHLQNMACLKSLHHSILVIEPFVGLESHTHLRWCLGMPSLMVRPVDPWKVGNENHKLLVLLWSLRMILRRLCSAKSLLKCLTFPRQDGYIGELLLLLREIHSCFGKDHCFCFSMSLYSFRQRRVIFLSLYRSFL